MSTRRKLLGVVEGSKVYADEILTDADRRAMASTLDWVAVPSHVADEGPAQVSDHVCPFCGEGAFDLLGLKHHIRMGWCEKWDEIENIQNEEDPTW